MPDTRLKKDDMLGDWRLEKLLGAGGQGEVWAVRYAKEVHSPRGALKVCFDRGDKARARFSQEIALLRDNPHEGIVRLRDSGEHDGHLFFVMERANATIQDIALGATPGTRLVGESRELVFRLLRQACLALAHLHANKVLHRDLKPSNVLLMLDPPEPSRAVLADLGVASVDADQGRLTATHETIGTPTFRAPETLRGHHTARSDVYSMGKTIEAVINRTSNLPLGPGTCLRDASLTDDLWDTLDAILRIACAYDPATRYADGAELLSALPVPVLGRGTSGNERILSPATTITLTPYELVALSEIIGQCPAVSDSTSVWQLKHESRLSDYHFSLAVRRLEILHFVENVESEDDRGYTYIAIRPSMEAIQWAHEHSEEIDDARADLRPKPTASSDDIPF